MTRLVQALEQDGLVRRQTDADDRRVWRIAATAKGRRLMMQGRKRRISALTQRINALSKADQRMLRTSLDVLERVTR